MSHRARSVLVALAALLISARAWAVDGIALEGGYGENTYRGGAALVWDWGVKWLPVGNWYLGGQWEASFSYWNGRKGQTGNDSLGEVGITPVFRIETDTPIGGVYPFLEGAIGAHVLTETTLANKRFGINYTFGDHLGGGVRFGDKGQYELNYRYQHLSNAGLGRYNSGINFHLLRLVYHFN